MQLSSPAACSRPQDRLAGCTRRAHRQGGSICAPQSPLSRVAMPPPREPLRRRIESGPSRRALWAISAQSRLLTCAFDARAAARLVDLRSHMSNTCARHHAARGPAWRCARDGDCLLRAGAGGSPCERALAADAAIGSAQGARAAGWRGLGSCGALAAPRVFQAGSASPLYRFRLIQRVAHERSAT